PQLLVGFTLDTCINQHPTRMPRDHELFVGRNHPRRDATRRRADPTWTAIICLGIELHAEPGGVAAHALAQTAAVLADAGREYDRAQAAQRGGERAALR